jgi:hypothetical protein
MQLTERPTNLLPFALPPSQLVISEIPDSAPMSLLAIKLLAQYSGKRVTPVRGPRRAVRVRVWVGGWGGGWTL